MNNDRAYEWSLCDKINRRIIEKYGEDSDTNDFPENERVIVLVWTAIGIIENGGFKYLFQSEFPGDSSYRQMFQAFRTINASSAIEAIKRAFDLFPNGMPPDDHELRISLYEMHEEETLHAINLSFYDAIEEATQSLFVFIINNGLHIKWKEGSLM